MNWQPIETAPKDGTKILAFGHGYPQFPMIWNPDKEPRVPMFAIIKWVEAWYDKEEKVSEGLYRKVPTQGYAYWQNPGHIDHFTPTHWMPLPDPPEPKEQP